MSHFLEVLVIWMVISTCLAGARQIPLSDEKVGASNIRLHLDAIFFSYPLAISFQFHISSNDSVDRHSRIPSAAKPSEEGIECVTYYRHLEFISSFFLSLYFFSIHFMASTEEKKTISNGT